jgi:spore cortex formation protein SpoVR/YcgB (stage V sporulation)
MMCDIERIVTEPTDEDREWFPGIAGVGDVPKVLRGIWDVYRDESFISQFLSPHLMRKMRLFQVVDDPNQEEGLEVTAIHDEQGFKKLRKAIAQSYDVSLNSPNIEIVDVDLNDTRLLKMVHRVRSDGTLQSSNANAVMQHLANLWGYTTVLEEVGEDGVMIEGESTFEFEPQLTGLLMP